MLLSLLLACGVSQAPPACGKGVDSIETPSGALSCDRAKIPTRYLRVLSGTPLPAGSTQTGIAEVTQRYGRDPNATRVWLDALASEARAIEQTDGLPGAELRAAALWRTNAGEGLFKADDAVFGNMSKAALSVRARDDEEKLALTENDIESWIQFASLCHEVQGAGVLRLSVANKVELYQLLRQRFEHGDRAEMVALASFGPAWVSMVPRWKAASYDEQQAWIAQVPLPTPMPTSSLGYIEAVIEGDVVNAARSVHQSFGPLHFRDGPGYFTRSP